MVSQKPSPLSGELESRYRPHPVPQSLYTAHKLLEKRNTKNYKSFVLTIPINLKVHIVGKKRGRGYFLFKFNP